MKNPISADSELAKRVFLRVHPGHEEWFDLAWETLLEKKQAGAVGLAGGSALGAQAGPDSSAAAMARDIAVLFEAILIKYPAVKSELATRLQSACQENAVDDEASGRLVEALLEENEVAGVAYVLRRSDGRTFPLEEVSFDEIPALAESAEVDFVVNEVGAESGIRFGSGNKAGEFKIARTSPRKRGMLWLVLNGVERNRFEIPHQAIADLFEMGRHYERNAIYQYAHAFRRWVDDALEQAVLGEGGGHEYSISPELSFVWIRRSESANLSGLVKGLCPRAVKY